MVETAAHLVDHVLTRVLNVVARTVSSAVLKRVGLSRSAGAETGIVTFI